jgi:hypothetical protein
MPLGIVKPSATGCRNTGNVEEVDIVRLSDQDLFGQGQGAIRMTFLEDPKHPRRRKSGGSLLSG